MPSSRAQPFPGTVTIGQGARQGARGGTGPGFVATGPGVGGHNGCGVRPGDGLDEELGGAFGTVDTGVGAGVELGGAVAITDGLGASTADAAAGRECWGLAEASPPPHAATATTTAPNPAPPSVNRRFLLSI